MTVHGPANCSAALSNQSSRGPSVTGMLSSSGNAGGASTSTPAGTPAGVPTGSTSPVASGGGPISESTSRDRLRSSGSTAIPPETAT
ncbi:hypothetical protein [Amycolatopsis albispora]|uniref:hypothetical protein n=1 Tax=Amycolatopsis albispora TaxID=1804986 RepID=UPI0013B4687C|nr:hypothetical protein [Amycolatopsis albispora]